MSSVLQDVGRKSPIPSLSATISDTPQGLVLGFALTARKDTSPSLTPARAATCLCRGDLSPMTLRCLEPSGNGGEGTRSQWGTAGSAEDPSPEAARLAKALRELGQTGRGADRPRCVREGAPPQRRSWEEGPRWEAKNKMEIRPLLSRDRGEHARRVLGPGECVRKVVFQRQAWQSAGRASWK